MHHTSSLKMTHFSYVTPEIFCGKHNWVMLKTMIKTDWTLVIVESYYSGDIWEQFSLPMESVTKSVSNIIACSLQSANNDITATLYPCKVQTMILLTLCTYTKCKQWYYCQFTKCKQWYHCHFIKCKQWFCCNITDFFHCT